MTVPLRPGRRVRDGRRFDLRTTALFFLLLAIILCVLSFMVRTAARVVEHRPLWAAVLALLGSAALVAYRSKGRRFLAARYARRAALALEEAAERASDSLRVPAAAQAEPAFPSAGTQTDPWADAEPSGRGHDEVCPGAEASSVAVTPPVLDAEEVTLSLDDMAGYAELDPDGFEQAIADLCVRDDCRDVEVVGGAGDLGADVIAVAPDGRRVVIQCKQYGESHKVGSQDMQRFGGTCFSIHEADIAAVVTTSDFTTPAVEYARQCGIVCVSGRELGAWHEGTGPSPWDREVVGP